MTGPDAWGPWAPVDEPERWARVRELRALSHTLLRPEHPFTAALAAALVDPAALRLALAELGNLPAVDRRRVMGTYAALHAPAKRGAA